jgi:hypothetical protein
MTERADTAKPAPPEREPTPQEDIIYDALTTGEVAVIEELRDTVLGPPADTQPAVEEAVPEPPPDPVEQFEQDLRHAWTRYQADNEAPEQERERLTAEAARRDNHEAMEGI